MQGSKGAPASARSMGPNGFHGTRHANKGGSTSFKPKKYLSSSWILPLLVHRSRARQVCSSRGPTRAGYDERFSSYSQKDVENFWGELLQRNFSLLRRSWSSVELVAGVPWLARERQRQRRLYQRRNKCTQVQELWDEEDNYAIDCERLSHARKCFELAKSAYSAHTEGGISALDRFLGETTVRAEDVHFIMDTSSFVKLAPVPGHLVVVSHEIKAVCVVIRGTEVRDKHGKSWLPVDVMADLAAESERFMGGHAHKGFTMIAEQLHHMHLERLQHLMDTHRDEDYELRVIGHSLGAGVAALLAMLLDKEPGLKGRVQCTAFSPPPVLSLGLARKCASIVDSFVVEDDIIPRLSISSINRLHSELNSYAWQRGASDEMRAELVFKIARRGKRLLHAQEDRDIQEGKEAAVAARRKATVQHVLQGPSMKIRDPSNVRRSRTVSNELASALMGDENQSKKATTIDSNLHKSVGRGSGGASSKGPNADIFRREMVWPTVTTAEAAILNDPGENSLLVLPELQALAKSFSTWDGGEAAGGGVEGPRGDARMPSSEIDGSRLAEWDLDEAVPKQHAAGASGGGSVGGSDARPDADVCSREPLFDANSMDIGTWSRWWTTCSRENKEEVLEIHEALQHASECPEDALWEVGMSERGDDSGRHLSCGSDGTPAPEISSSEDSKSIVYCEFDTHSSHAEEHGRRSGDHYRRLPADSSGTLEGCC
mmetsp:Transcript_27622/g.52578  ORF Transcript_27622/g.52578 Transcript_27622/m.52578 type:complete len:716 (-) Transcript_27622:362-2509(-)